MPISKSFTACTSALLAITASRVDAQSTGTTQPSELPAASELAWQEPVGAPGVPPADKQPDAFSFGVRAGVWLPRLGGKVTLGDGPDADRIIVEDQLDLDDQEATFLGELSIVKDDRWDIGVSGFAFSTDSSGVFSTTTQFGALEIDPGDRFDASFDITSLDFKLTWWGFTPVNEPKTGVSLSFGPTAGIRYVDVDQSIELLSGAELGTQDAGGEWLVPHVGGELALEFPCQGRIPLLNCVIIHGGMDIGPALGGDGGFVTDIRAGMTFRFTDNLGGYFGYRLLDMSVENDDYEFRGGLQGLYFGGSFTF